jgi:DNA-binding Lrp family transcriptional regulator
MILDQNLKSGSKIYQEQLAEDLGISRTPLVNAPKKLEQEHLIRVVRTKLRKAAGGKRLADRGIEEGKPCRTMNR